jgi:hypothetical protein
VKNIIFIIYTALFLVACGGSSITTKSTPNNSDNREIDTKTGVFIDAPVKGLVYVSSPSGKEGITNDEGEFEYIDGDTVSFNMGSIELGSATPDKTNKVKVTQLEQALLVAQLLQVLDTDADENKIDISDIVIPEAVKKAIIDKLSDTDGDASTSDVITSAQLVSIKQANPEKLTLQQRTGVIPKDKVLEHIEQQIGEPGLSFSALELANQLFFDASLLTKYMGAVSVLPSVKSNPAKWIVVDDGKATLSQPSWNVNDQGNMLLDFQMYIGDQGHTVNTTCTLSKIAEGDYSIDMSASCPVPGSEAINRNLGTILKPQPFSANDLSGKSFNFTSLSGNKETLTFRNDGTLNCNGENSSCPYKDHPSYKNTVWIEGGGDRGEKSALVILAQGSFKKGKFLIIHYKDHGNTLDSIEVIKVSGSNLIQEFESVDNDHSIDDHNHNTDEHSDPKNNLNSDTQNSSPDIHSPNYIPFTLDMISGKTLYNVYNDWDDEDKDGSTTDLVAVKFIFDESNRGEGVFGINDSFSTADANFDYNIDDNGYLILSNVIFTNPDDDPDDDHNTDVVGLIEETEDYFKVCWRGNIEQLKNFCTHNVELIYKTKTAAEAALNDQSSGYIPFAQEKLSGKRYYGLGVEDNEGITIFFGGDNKGQVWLDLTESTSSPDMTFDYLIDSAGYVIFSNVLEKGVSSNYKPAMALLGEIKNTLVVCWDNFSVNNIRDLCVDGTKLVLYKTKEAAEAEVRAHGEPDSQTSQHIPFTTDMIKGKTLYSFSPPDDYDDQITKVTVQFDNSTGKFQFGYHDNVTSPYGTFDYSIDSQGYLIFSNVVIDGSPIPVSPIHALMKKESAFLEVCVASSEESIACIEEVWFYDKKDAEAAVENQ